MSRYLSALTEAFIAEGGTVDKFIGDAVMVFWNAPNPLPDHVERACRAALAGKAACEKLNSEFVSEGLKPFFTRFGIHVGEAVVGNLGSTERMNYTALGNTVNLASRLEGLNKQFGTTILVSEAVHLRVQTPLQFQSIRVDHRQRHRSALLTQDRVLHNLVIGPGFPESDLTDRRLARVSAVDKYLPVSRSAPRSSYAHQSDPEAQAITECLFDFLSEHQLKQFRTKRRRIRAYFGTSDNIAAAALTIGQRRTSCGVLGGESGCPPRSEGSACGKRELCPRSIKLR